jgi:hypothetical protein
MRRPLHQIAITWIGYIGLGMLALGSIADAVSNALQLFRPVITYVGSAALAGGWLVTLIWLRVHPITWVARGGAEVRLRSLGPRFHLGVVGVGLLLWFPRMVDWEKASTSEQVKPLSEVKSTSPWVRVTDLSDLTVWAVESSDGSALTVSPSGTVRGTVSDPRLAVFLAVRLVEASTDSVTVKALRSRDGSWSISEATVDAVGNWQARNLCFHPHVYPDSRPDYDFWEVKAFATFKRQSVIDARGYLCDVASEEIHGLGVVCSEGHIKMRPPKVGFYMGPSFGPKPQQGCFD